MGSRIRAGATPRAYHTRARDSVEFPARRPSSRKDLNSFHEAAGLPEQKAGMPQEPAQRSVRHRGSTCRLNPVGVTNWMVVRGTRTLAAGVATASVAALIAVLGWPSRCPVEPLLFSKEPVEVYDDAGTQMCLLMLSLRNWETAGIVFDGNAAFEAEVRNRWVEIPNSLTVGGLAPRGSPRTNQMMFLMPAAAEACRIRLKYHFAPSRARLPLGIGDRFARYYPPSELAAGVQHVTLRFSPRLYSWLWPAPTNASSWWDRKWPPHWKKMALELKFPDWTATRAPSPATHKPDAEPARFASPGVVQARQTLPESKRCRAPLALLLTRIFCCPAPCTASSPNTGQVCCPEGTARE